MQARPGRRQVGAGPVRQAPRPPRQGRPGSGPRERMVPLINNAGRTLRWFVGDVWAKFGDDHTRPGGPLLAPGAPLLPAERKHADGTAARVGDETLRSALARVAAAHLPDWPEV